MEEFFHPDSVLILENLFNIVFFVFMSFLKQKNQNIIL